MPKAAANTVTITAPQGVRLKVTTQVLEHHEQDIPEVRDSENNLVVPGRKEPYAVWTPKKVETVASGARDFGLDDETRIVVMAENFDPV